MITMMGVFTSRRWIGLLGIVAAMLLAVVFTGSLNSWGESPPYPVRSVTFISPWSPGASPDRFTRTISPELSKRLGVPINIVCKPGGSGTVGTLAAMQARPDGSTILIDCPGSCSLQEAWRSELPYKVFERIWIARAAAFPTFIVVPSDRPWKTMKDIEDAIRRDPASFRWTMIGTAHPDLTMRLFKGALASRGVDLSKTKNVPFIGGAKAYTGLAGGHTDIYSGSLASTGPLMDAGKLRPIAVTSKERSKFRPDVPTTAEQGFPTVLAAFWLGYTGPPGLPKNVVKMWISAIKATMNDPAMTPKFDKLGVDHAFLAGEDFEKFVREETEAARSVAGM
jgi:tripartite-type tricarboxylate transporter receptor subunit TctC